MKKLLFVLLATLSFQITYAQSWTMTWGEPDFFTEFVSIHFPTPDTGFLIGNASPYQGTYENGRVFRTTDGGMSFSLVYGSFPPPPTRACLRDLHFVNSNLGFVVGDSGIVLKTVNGGITWTQQSSGYSQILQKVFFINSNVGFVLTQDYTWLRTTDGGNSWSAPLMFGAAPIIGYDIDFPTSSVGYINKPDTLFKTTDGGLNWQAIPLSTIGIGDISFVSATTGFAIVYLPSSHRIVKTVDGGVNWTELDSTLVPPEVWYRSLKFLNADTGYVIRDYTILLTDDGGINWHESYSFSGQFPRLICFANKLCGYAITYATSAPNHTSSYVYKTLNGGGVNIPENCLNSLPGVAIWPNPSDGELNIDLKAMWQQNCHVSLLNSCGQELLSQKVNGESSRMNLDQLPDGLYILRIETESESMTNKVVVRH